VREVTIRAGFHGSAGLATIGRAEEAAIWQLADGVDDEQTNIRSSAGPGRIAAGGREMTISSGSGKSGPEPSAFCRNRGCGKMRKRVPV
jgi:hypothetical protein